MIYNKNISFNHYKCKHFKTFWDVAKKFRVISVPLDTVERVSHHLVIINSNIFAEVSDEYLIVTEQGKILTDLGQQRTTVKVLQNYDSTVNFK